MVFAVRDPSEDQELGSLPVMVVGGLSDADARALLDSATPGRLDERVRDRVVAESNGNPLALLELPKGLTAAELAGGFGRPDARPLVNRHRAELSPAGPGAPGRDAATPPGSGGGAGGGRDPAVAGGRGARDRRRRSRAGRGGRADRARRPGAVPSSAGALGGLPRGSGTESGRRSIERWPR